MVDPQVLITISQLSHTYPGTRKTAPQKALKNITLDIRTGEMVALLGPNGSGKSTLLRILMTVLHPSSGSVRLGELDLVKKSHAVRRFLGVVFQKPALDGKMTVGENLRATGLLYHIPRRELKDRVDSILGEMGLSDRRDDLVENLSGGLARRVELAKALLPRPRILILDEPTTSLDPLARQEFWRAIEVLRAEKELTVLLTTHLLDEGERCDRVAILHQGNLLAYDHPLSLQRSIGREVLSIQGDELDELQRDLRESFMLEGRIVDDSLRLALSEPVSLDALVQRFQSRIKKLTLSHPSLDDVFVQLTGEHLAPGERGVS